MRLNRFILTGPAYLRLKQAGPLVLVLSVIAFVLALANVIPMGVFGTSIFGMQFGAAWLFARKWSRWPGDWMLGILLGVSFACFTLAATSSVAYDIVQQPHRHWPEGVDMCFADVLAILSLWMIWTASVWNWRWFNRRDGETPRTPPPKPSPVPSWPHGPLPSLSAHARAPQEPQTSSFARSEHP